MCLSALLNLGPKSTFAAGLALKVIQHKMQDRETL